MTLRCRAEQLTDVHFLIKIKTKYVMAATMSSAAVDATDALLTSSLRSTVIALLGDVTQRVYFGAIIVFKVCTIEVAQFWYLVGTP